MEHKKLWIYVNRKLLGDPLEKMFYEKYEFFRVKKAYYLGKNLGAAVPEEGQSLRKTKFLSQKRNSILKTHTL